MSRILLLAAMLSPAALGSAMAAEPATPTPSPAMPAPAPDPVEASGVVKSLDATKHSIVIAVGGMDRSFNTAAVVMPKDVKAGSAVDFTYRGEALVSLKVKA